VLAKQLKTPVEAVCHWQRQHHHKGVSCK
jgi:hypothetical protein